MGCGWWWWWFPAITLSQPNYSDDCFVVGVVVVVGLWQLSKYIAVMIEFISALKIYHCDVKYPYDENLPL